MKQTEKSSMPVIIIYHISTHKASSILTSLWELALSCSIAIFIASISACNCGKFNQSTCLLVLYMNLSKVFWKTSSYWHSQIKSCQSKCVSFCMNQKQLLLTIIADIPVIKCHHFYALGTVLLEMGYVRSLDDTFLLIFYFHSTDIY